MAAATVTTLDAALKQRYTDKRVKFVGYSGNPFLALCPKMESFTGRNMPIVVHHGGNMGASRLFATAQANKTAGLYEDFLLTRRKDYGLTSIELEALQASASDVGAFLRASTVEIDNTLRTVGRNLAISMYRNSGGARGQVGSTSTTTLTLLKTSDVTNFDVGMEIDSDDTDGTSGAVDGDPHTVTAIDRIDGTLTSDTNWDASGNFADNDYLFREGDFGNSIDGLDAWIPASDPTSTPFLGVDRSVDVTRLGGLRKDVSSYTLEEGLQVGEILVAREGGKPSHVLMNHDDYGDLRKSLGSRVVYDKAVSPDMASISFETIVLQGSAGPIKVVADRNCPKGVAYMLQMDTWVLASLGPAPKISEAMGNKFIWDYNADSIEVRTCYFANLGCYAPGYNIRLTLPS